MAVDSHDWLNFSRASFGYGNIYFDCFFGIVPNSVIWALIVSNYLFKCGIEILFTPMTYMVTNWLKRQEQEDYYDTNTNFNPFRFSKTS